MNQTCSNGQWTALNVELVQTAVNLFDWLRFPGTILINGSFLIETDLTIGGNLIVPSDASLMIRGGAYLRVIGDLIVEENATVSIDQAVLQVGGINSFPLVPACTHHVTPWAPPTQLLRSLQNLLS